MRLLKEIDVSGKRVFVRADLDVPIGTFNAKRLTTNAEGATRLTNLAPTVDWLIEHGAKQIIIAGHINRPSVAKALEGKPPLYDKKLSTRQLLPTLEKILGQKIAFSEQLTIDNLHLTERNKSMVNGQWSNVILLENLRFWPGEVANDLEFAKQLALLADVYINEAFGNCHRAHASMVQVPALLPHGAGLHLGQEVKVLSDVLENPKHPFVAIVGGVKIETKVPVVENLAKIADFVLVGGEIAKQLTIDNLQLTTDKKFHNKSNVKGQMSTVMVATLTEDGKDISGESIHQFKEEIAKAKTVVWNGPMGVFEEGFEAGTLGVAQAIIDSAAYSVVGGGETTQFLASKNLLGRFGFVSSGGGAMLEFLAGKELPGLKALE